MMVPPVYPTCAQEKSRHFVMASRNWWGDGAAVSWCDGAGRDCGAGGHVPGGDRGLFCCVWEERAQPGPRMSSRDRVDSSFWLSPCQHVAAAAASYSAQGIRVLCQPDHAVTDGALVAHQGEDRGRARGVWWSHSRRWYRPKLLTKSTRPPDCPPQKRLLTHLRV